MTQEQEGLPAAIAHMYPPVAPQLQTLNAASGLPRQGTQVAETATRATSPEWMGQLKPLLTLMLAVLFLCSCHGSASEYNSALQSATRMTSASQFLTIYGNGAHKTVLYYDGMYGTPRISVSGILWGRYLITMQQDVAFSRRYTQADPVGEVTVYINEIKEVGKLSDGRLYMLYGRQYDCKSSDWDEIVKAKGDISKVFEGIRTPVERVLDAELAEEYDGRLEIKGE